MALRSTLLDHTYIVSTITGGILTGSAIYIAFWEVPALHKSGPNEFWRFFPYMYSHTAKMQATLGIVSGTAGLIYSLRIADSSPFLSEVWLGAALAYFSVVPYPLFIMPPTYKQIIQSNKTWDDEPEKKTLINKWLKLHLLRTVISLAGFGAMVYGCLLKSNGGNIFFFHTNY